MANDRRFEKFRFRAEIDWISFEMLTGRRTNIEGIRNHLRDRFDISPHVRSLDKNGNPFSGHSANSPSNRFQITLHDPGKWDEVDVILTYLERKYGFVSPVKVTGAEIALDAYSRGATERELAEMVAGFCKFQFNPVSENRRLVWKERAEENARILGAPDAFLYSDLCHYMENGATVYLGNQKTTSSDHTRDPLSQRAYLKRTTTRNGEVIPLPETEYRARLELIIQRGENGEEGLSGKNGLPGTNWNDWKNCRFEFIKKGGYFQFVTFRDEDTFSDRERELAALGFHKYFQRRGMQLGRKKVKRLPIGGKVVRTGRYRVFTRADQELNGFAYEALRGLSQRWEGKNTGSPVFRH